MNNKGFTLIELITTFALSAVIIIFLINIIVVSKNIYSKNESRSNLIIEQSNLSYMINKKIYNNKYDSYDSCGIGCYNIAYKDGTTSNLTVTTNSIKFDNYVYKKSTGITIGTPVVGVDTSFFTIKIPIYHKLYPNENFGVDIVYLIDL